MKSTSAVRSMGFTLIELVIVMVLLGVLGVVATARFQDLSGTAETNARQAVAAEIQSSSAINYAVAATNGTPDQAITAATNACNTVVPGLMATGAMPSGYTTAGNTNPACAALGDVVQCTVTQTSTAATVDVNLLCTGP